MPLQDDIGLFGVSQPGLSDDIGIFDDTPQKEDDPGVIRLAGRGLAHGTIGIAESVGLGVQYAGHRMEKDASEIPQPQVSREGHPRPGMLPATAEAIREQSLDTQKERVQGLSVGLQEVGKTTAEHWGRVAEDFAPPDSIAGKNVIDEPGIMADPSWWVYNVADMVPSLAASLIPGAGAHRAITVGGKTLQLSPVVIKKLAKYGAAVTGGVAGGSIEGTQTYKAVLESGGSEEEAARAGETMTLFSGMLNAISTGNLLSKAGPGFMGMVKKFGIGGVVEGITEGAEEPAEVMAKIGAKMITGQEVPENIGHLFLESLKEAATVFPIAALTGGVGGVAAGNQEQDLLSRSDGKWVDEVNTALDGDGTEAQDVQSPEIQTGDIEYQNKVARDPLYQQRVKNQMDMKREFGQQEGESIELGDFPGPQQALTPPKTGIVPGQEVDLLQQGKEILQRRGLEVPLPAEVATTPALPPGQGFELQGEPYTPDILPARAGLVTPPPQQAINEPQQAEIPPAQTPAPELVPEVSPTEGEKVAPLPQMTPTGDVGTADRRDVVRPMGRLEERRTGQDRRLDPESRAAFDAMSEEERYKSLFYDDLTGLPNKRGFENYHNQHPEHHVMRMDMDNLHNINKILGYDATDRVIKKMADIADASGVEIRGIAREKGDEFLASGVPENLDKFGKLLTEKLSKAKIVVTLPDGSEYEFNKGIGVSHGYGPTAQEAEVNQNRHKQERSAQGLRAPEDDRAGTVIGLAQRIAPRDQAEKHRVSGLKTPAGTGQAVALKAEPEQAETIPEPTTEAGIDTQANEAATSPKNDLPYPTDAQIEKGVYKKGHIKVQGLDITIENPDGSTRSGTSPDGKKWETTMQGHYGYFKRSEGKDGDQVDVFVSTDPKEKHAAYIVDQVDPDTGKFDEHKVIVGTPNIRAAKKLYMANYEKGWQGFGAITKVEVPELKKWLAGGKQTKAYGKDVIRETTVPKRAAKPQKVAPKAPKESKVQTLRGRIKKAGGINFLNFKGEYKNMPTEVKFLSNKKTGVPIDALEQTLKDEGWIDQGEDLLDILTQGKAVLKRGRVVSSGTGAKTDHQREQERKFKESSERAPEEPPPGEYVEMKAEDLPRGKDLTIIDGSGKDGWDEYKVIDKDPFGVTLKDGTIVELKPLDTVQVRKADLPKDTAKAKQAEIDIEDTLFDEPQPAAKPKPAKREKSKSDQEQKGMFTHNQADMFGSRSKTPKFSKRKASPWHSQMTRFLDQKLPGAGSPAQLSQTIESWAKKGLIKQEELEWSGLSEWLKDQKGKVKKQDVLNYLAENNVRVEEVEKRSETRGAKEDILNTKDAEGWREYLDENQYISQIELNEMSDSEIIEAVSEEIDEGNITRGNVVDGSVLGDTKFADYQLPGGENYFEFYLTWPGLKGSGWSVPQYHQTGDKQVDEEQIVRVRASTRTDADGSRVLLLDEIQGDLHQEGRKNGYGRQLPEGYKVRKKRNENYWRVLSPSNMVVTNWVGSEQEAVSQALSIINQRDLLPGKVGVPDAPFKKTWPLLTIKRMVRYAAENGFDKIAWTPGEVQSDRYDLSKQVDSVSAAKLNNGKYNVQVQKDGNLVFDKVLEENELGDFIGKELAQKIIENKEVQYGNFTTFSGLDLKVGGEGMSGFYDKILPSAVNKFFNKGAWGKAKVGTTNIGGADSRPGGRIASDGKGYWVEFDGEKYGPTFDSAAEAMDERAKMNSGMVEVWSLPITEKMRQKALSEGMPLFRTRTDISKGRLKKQSIERRVNDRIKNWSNAPDIKVVQSQSELPNSILDHVAKGEIVDGVFHNGTVYLVAENLTTERAIKTLLHEAVGHYGIRGLLSGDTVMMDEYTEFEKALLETKSKEIADIAEGYEFDLETEDGRFLAVEEYLAREAGKGTRSTFLNRAIRMISQWLRKVFPSMRVTRSEIKAWIGDARHYVKYGEKETAPETSALSPAFSIRQDEPPDFIKEKFGRSHRTIGEKLREGIDMLTTKERRADLFDAMVTQGFDRLNPVHKVGEQSYMFHRIQTGDKASFSMLMEYGPLVWDKSGFMTIGGIEHEKGKIKKIFSPVKKQGFLPFLRSLGKDWEKFFYWTAARRAEVLESEGREFWLDANTRDKIFKWAGGRTNRKWMAAAKKLKEFNASVLDLAEKAGLIEPGARALWEQDFYVPFYRIFEDDAQRQEFLKAPRKGKRYISAQIKRLHGAEKKLGDPLENLLHNWTHLISESMRNVARAEAYDYAMEAGDGLVEDARPSDIYSFKQGKKDKKTAYAFKKDDTPVLMFQRDGKPVYFKVNDEELFNAMSEINTPNFNNFALKLFGKAKRGLTFGATFGPGFRVANLIRDTMHTAMLEKDFKAFADSAKGFVKAMREDQDYIKFMASGAGFGSSYVEADNPEVTAKFIRRVIKGEGKGAARRILDTPKKLFDLWEKIGSAAENAARVQLYKNLTDAGETHTEAAFRGRDLLDFTMRGESRTVQIFIRIIPFLNARMQGLYKLGRAAKDKNSRRNMAIRGAMLTTASLALWWAFKDDDRYKELEDWERWSYYHFWIGDKHYRIPKPFELGAIFSSFPETVANTMYGNDDTKHIVDFIGHTAHETLAIGFPQIGAPMIEQWANKSSFTDRPIVGRHLEGIVPGEQADPWTSETLQLLGEKMGVSPKRAEHLIKGYFATFGSFVVGGADIITSALYDFPENPSTRIDDYPLVGRFVREGGPARHTKHMTWFYDTFPEMDRFAKTLQAYRATGRIEKAIKIANRPEVAKKIAMSRKFHKIRQAMSEIHKRIRIIWYDQKMSKKEKRKQIDDLIRARNDAVKTVFEEYLNME